MQLLPRFSCCTSNTCVFALHRLTSLQLVHSRRTQAQCSLEETAMLSTGLLAAYGISLFGVSYPLFGNLCKNLSKSFTKHRETYPSSFHFVEVPIFTISFWTMGRYAASHRKTHSKREAHTTAKAGSVRAFLQSGKGKWWAQSTNHERPCKLSLSELLLCPSIYRTIWS